MWAYILSTILGIWLMAAPAALGYGGAARAGDQIVGPIAASFAIIAIAEITRPARWVNFVLGLWLLAAPWIWSYPMNAAINSLAMGLLLAGLSLVRGKYRPENFGGGWSSLWRDTNFPANSNKKYEPRMNTDEHG